MLLAPHRATIVSSLWRLVRFVLSCALSQLLTESTRSHSLRITHYQLRDSFSDAMQLTFTDVGMPSDGAALQNAITPQDAEICHLRNECNVAKAELQSLKSELDEWHSLRDVTRELRDLLRDGRDHGLREQLSAMENINGMLRAQLQEEQRRVSAAELCNESLQSETLSSNGARLDLEETLLRNERISMRLKEADDIVRFLESRLDEMEERARVAEREQEWTEQQLVYSSQYVKDLLVEISSLRTIQQGLEKDAPSAFCRGLRLNTDLLDRAQGELVRAKAREVTLLLEVVDLKDRLKHEPKLECQQPRIA
ncbi:hypothetical protein DAEQUDRAFT_427932 [Daedalea quercina L-15889]|uniref:Uncharacterized protein n=1 Tax=Daedalea quercina L-15889 TaxID=1314783 RepID=A0A165NJ76_9APHY|nr:hypothetical protein DAEQUDRAFT_427932 [Daedalea quercina L-15889]